MVTPEGLWPIYQTTYPNCNPFLRIPSTSACNPILAEKYTDCNFRNKQIFKFSAREGYLEGTCQPYTPALCHNAGPLPNSPPHISMADFFLNEVPSPPDVYNTADTLQFLRMV